MKQAEKTNDGRTIAITFFVFLGLCVAGVFTAGLAEEVQSSITAELILLAAFLLRIAVIACIGFFLFAVIRAEWRLRRGRARR